MSKLWTRHLIALVLSAMLAFFLDVLARKLKIVWMSRLAEGRKYARNLLENLFKCVF